MHYPCNQNKNLIAKLKLKATVYFHIHRLSSWLTLTSLARYGKHIQFVLAGTNMASPTTLVISLLTEIIVKSLVSRPPVG